MRRSLLPLAAAAVLSALFLLFVCKFDNKYTYPSPQPIGGVLWLDAAALKKHPAGFLRDGWIVYPGKLLTPREIREGKWRREEIRIGGGALTDGKSPVGAATYHLRIRLPEEERGYALELPEIFSAYKLYVNGHETEQVGDPAAGLELTGARLISFRAASSADIVIAAANRNHFYGGLVYPPAFGETRAVQRIILARLARALAVVAFALASAAASLYFAVALAYVPARLYSLLCLAFIGSSSYPIIHALFDLPLRPWYALEIFCGYLAIALAVTLHNRICGVTGRRARVVECAAYLVAAASLAYGLLSPRLPFAAELFPEMIFIYKSAVAAYLIKSAIGAGTAGKTESSPLPLLGADVFFAAAILFDRIYPEFEPIITGWFPEMGTFALVAAIGIQLWRDLAQAWRERRALRENERRAEKELGIHLSYIEALREKIDENRRFRHDHRQLLRTLSALAAGGDEKTLHEYIKNLENAAPPASVVKYSENAVIDALIGHYAAAAKKNGLPFDVIAPIPAGFALSDTELCRVLGNLIENAADAAAGAKAPYVRVSGSETDAQSIIIIANSYGGTIKKRGGKYLSSKHEGTGLGIASAQKIAEQNGGSLIIETTEKTFTATLFLPKAGR